MSKGNVIKGYSSLAELAQVALTSDSGMSTAARASRRTNDNEWSGGTWNDAKQLIMSGDIEGARRLRVDMLTAVNAMMGNTPRLDPGYDVDGGQWVDVARFVKGEPECWGSMEEGEPAPRRAMAVVVNVAASARVTAGSLDKLGVSVGSAILGLQAQGYAVTLYLAEKIGGDGGCLLVHAPVNPGASSLDISKMSAILRPWFLRRIIFSLEETFSEDIRERFGISEYGGYGSPRELLPEDTEAISGRKDAIVIDVNNAVGNPKAVKDLILRQTQGVK